MTWCQQGGRTTGRRPRKSSGRPLGDFKHSVHCVWGFPCGLQSACWEGCYGKGAAVSGGWKRGRYNEEWCRLHGPEVCCEVSRLPLLLESLIYYVVICVAALSGSPISTNRWQGVTVTPGPPVLSTYHLCCSTTRASRLLCLRSATWHCYVISQNAITGTAQVQHLDDTLGCTSLQVPP